jgi:hypothetical protein
MRSLRIAGASTDAEGKRILNKKNSSFTETPFKLIGTVMLGRTYEETN